MEILLGAAAGVVSAVMCALFYRKGVRDGMSLNAGSRKNKAFWGVKKKTAPAADLGGEDMGNELMRKYDLIMSYDPYGEKV